MFTANYLELAKTNTDFRRVLVTGEHSQVVLMSLSAGVDIGLETHETIDQIFLIIQGSASVFIAGETGIVAEGQITLVPAGAEHNVTNTGNGDLKLVTIYSPPAHPDGTVLAHKADD